MHGLKTWTLRCALNKAHMPQGAALRLASANLSMQSEGPINQRRKLYNHQCKDTRAAHSCTLELLQVLTIKASPYWNNFHFDLGASGRWGLGGAIFGKLPVRIVPGEAEAPELSIAPGLAGFFGEATLEDGDCMPEAAFRNSRTDVADRRPLRGLNGDAKPDRLEGDKSAEDMDLLP